MEEDLAGNVTKDEKTSINEGLLSLLEMLKDGENDQLSLGNSIKSRQLDSRSIKDTEESIEEDAESGKGSGYASKEMNKPSKCSN